MPKINKKILISMLMMLLITSCFTPISVSDTNSGVTNVNLTLSFSQNPVNELEEFTITVVAPDGYDVSGVYINVNGAQIGYTNIYGELTTNAPGLNPEDGDFVIYVIEAVKYNNGIHFYGQSLLRVDQYLELYIDSVNPDPVVVLEGETFTVTVKDQDYNKLAGAYVNFNDKKYKTNFMGVASVSAPADLSEDTTFTLSAEKDYYDFIGDNVEVTVRNRYLTIGFIYPNPVDELQEFHVTVKDQDGNGLSGATVYFNGKSRFTRNDGRTVNPFTAPEVELDTTYTITASKAWPYHYDMLEAGSITVINANTIPVEIYGKILADNLGGLSGATVTIISTTEFEASSTEYTTNFFTTTESSGGDTTISDENGNYSFIVYPMPGGTEYKITASADGYKTNSKIVTIDQENDSSGPYHIVLSPSGNQQGTPSSQQNRLQFIRNVINNLFYKFKTAFSNSN